MSGLWARLAREPVLAGAAVIATLEAAVPDLSPGWKLAAGAWVALFQRALSTPKAAADERVEVAKYVGAVEHQATVLAAQIPPRRPLRAQPPADGMPPA